MWGSAAHTHNPCILPGAHVALEVLTVPRALCMAQVGMVLFPSYGTVTRHDADANVLEGCQVIVEGCMNSSAINYDPEANTNTGTWCVPMVRGCMMPQAINFDSSATFNDVATCIAPGPRPPLTSAPSPEG